MRGMKLDHLILGVEKIVKFEFACFFFSKYQKKFWRVSVLDRNGIKLSSVKVFGQKMV